MNSFFKKYHIFKLIIIIILNVFDILITYFGLTYGLVREANPIAVALINWGWVYAISVKMSLLIPIALYILWAIKENKEKHAKWLLNFIIIFYILISINNSIALFW